MKNIFNYDEVPVIILKLFIVLLVIISIAIFVKLGIEINTAINTSKEVDKLKQKYTNITTEYNEIHKNIEVLLSEE